MDESHVESALNSLNLVRQTTDVIGCAVSFGKDSLATLDLCCRVFRRVEGYYLFRVRGLEIVEQWTDEVRQRTGVTVRMYPHFDLSRCYRNAVLQPHWKTKAPRVSMRDVERKFRQDAHVQWIAYGWRRSDSLSRALIMKSTGGYDVRAKRVFPLRVWKNRQVYEYLDQRQIPRPPTLGRKEQGGLDFHVGALQALSSADRERWMTDFPYAGVQLIDAEAAADRK